MILAPAPIASTTLYALTWPLPLQSQLLQHRVTLLRLETFGVAVLQVADLIAMTLQVHKSLPRDARGSLAVDQYTMPANFRRRLKSLRNAPPICFSLPLDTTRRYEVRKAGQLSIWRLLLVTFET